jgi:predicted ATPase
VQRQTEGNPLFVRETLRFVIDTGLMERRDGALRRVGDQTLAGRIPEGLRDAVGKRLSRLSESTNRFLSVASVIGRESHSTQGSNVDGLTGYSSQHQLAAVVARPRQG